MQGDVETSFFITPYNNNERGSFDLWREIFSKNMTANVHLLIAHGDLYLRWVGSNIQCYEVIKTKQSRWSQEDIGVPLSILTEGIIEKCNQDVKQTCSKFVARLSM